MSTCCWAFFLMFSYFENGILNVREFKNISIEKLIRLVKEYNPAIERIRSLDINDVDYDNKKRKLKSKLSYITPNCTVTYRDDKNIDKFSGYTYFDIDNKGKIFNSREEVLLYKTELIEKYKDVIKLICISSSGYGLSILVKVENEINHDNFYSIREYICREVFTDVPLDTSTKDKSRAWYVSYDPDCYYNPYAIIEIPENKIENRKGANDNINNSPSELLSFAPSKSKPASNKKYTYQLINISEVLSKLKFRTQVEVENRIFDIKDVEICEVYIPPNYRIPDGKKRMLFSIYIRNLFHLNPEVDADYIFSYINWINEKRTMPGTKMVFSQLIHLFGSIHKSIVDTGVTKHITRTVQKHFKENTISKFEKRRVTREISDLLRIANSINKVQLAKLILEKNRKGAIDNINNSSSELLSIAPIKKVTQKEVLNFINERAKLTNSIGISIRTVKEYWNYEMVDIKEIEKIENERLEITYISKTEREGCPDGDVTDSRRESVSDNQIQDETNSTSISIATDMQPLNEPESKPDWWRSLDYYEETYKELGKEMY